MEQNQRSERHEKENGDPAVWSILLGFIGGVFGLVAGFFLFVWSYRPFTGLGKTPVWQVSLMDGIIIAGTGGAAFLLRKKSAFLQGILISAALLFIVNGLCGISGK